MSGVERLKFQNDRKKIDEVMEDINQMHPERSRKDNFVYFGETS